MNWLALNWQLLAQLSLRHLIIAGTATIAALAVALPLGRAAFRFPRIGGALLSGFSLLYAVPSLPLLIIIPGILAIPLRSSLTLVIVLAIYGVALLVRSVADGFSSVDPVVRDAAIALGNSPRSIFWSVDLPLATPVILAGLRVAAVSTIGLVTIGALIGVSSLGTLLTDGFQRGIVEEVAAGTIATMLLALLVDGVIVGIGSLLTPWNRRRHRGSRAAA